MQLIINWRIFYLKEESEKLAKSTGWKFIEYFVRIYWKIVYFLKSIKLMKKYLIKKIQIIDKYYTSKKKFEIVKHRSIYYCYYIKWNLFKL
ncbi:MAG: hypothetical protein HCTKY_2160 [Candidatus Hepatoplasma crinochetorum]|nr:MAG: hypothetical protein HCTKY_2160 [Candidatus Hepatoplasma crinochetorum]